VLYAYQDSDDDAYMVRAALDHGVKGIVLGAFAL
jgi:hypothetical protein